METAREKVTANIRRLISENKVRVTNAIGLLRVAMQEVERLNEFTGSQKQSLVIEVLSRIAKGPDGISGTQDDLIPPLVIDGVRVLIESNLIGATIDLIIDATRGRLDINKVNTCMSSLVSCLTGLR